MFKLPSFFKIRALALALGFFCLFFFIGFVRWCFAGPETAVCWAYQDPVVIAGSGNVNGYWNFGASPAIDQYGQFYAERLYATQTSWFCPTITSQITKIWYFDLDLQWHLYSNGGAYGNGACYTVSGWNAWLAAGENHYSYDDNPLAPNFVCNTDCQPSIGDQDVDGDGACNRCDYMPDEPSVGKHLYGLSEDWFQLTEHNNDPSIPAILTGINYTYFPSEVYSSLSSSEKELATFHSNADSSGTDGMSVGPGTNILNPGNTRVQIPEHEIIATLDPCVCGEECHFSFSPYYLSTIAFGQLGITEAGLYIPNSAPVDGVDPDPSTLPNAENDFPNQSNPVPSGEYGQTQPGLPAPPPGSGSDLNLESIAANSSISTTNLNVIGNTLDGKLSKLNFTAEQIARNTARTANALDALVEAANDPNSDPSTGTYTPETLSNDYQLPADVQDASEFSARFSTFINDLKATPLFSLPGQVLGNIPSGGEPVYNVNMGSYGSVDLDLSQYSGVFAIVRSVLLVCFSFAALRIVASHR